MKNKTKYLKQRKKEKANRKAKQIGSNVTDARRMLEVQKQAFKVAEEAAKEPATDRPISAARKAFQDV
ncbi:hypothetical protein LCGC14_0591220 [marine sediment metagenome]|uniref:Uncharacterized protein n=1 Tax=marine sediment metagenome TaxID=412755 RepID=A0A0F9RDA4_9ZZZZ